MQKLNHKKISVQHAKFETEWNSTGIMIDESPTVKVQTYSNERYTGRYKQVGKIRFGGIRIVELEKVV